MKSKRAQSVTYSSSTVESVLLNVFVLKYDDIDSLYARIRYLRTCGVPHNMPPPGRGRPLLFSLDQVMQLSFALRLEDYGVTPKRAAEMGPAMAMATKWMRVANPNEDIYAICGLADEPQIIPGLERLQAWIGDEFTDREKDGAFLLNASRLMQRVEQELQREELNERSQDDDN
jgi:hypothetical protein